MSGGVPVGQGAWLFARLAVHKDAGHPLGRNRQEPLEGLGLRVADWFTVCKIQLELATARVPASHLTTTEDST